MLQVKITLQKHSSQQWSTQIHDTVHMYHYWQKRLSENLSVMILHPQVETQIKETVEHLEKHQGDKDRTIRKKRTRELKEVRTVNRTERESRREYLREIIEMRFEAEARPIKAILHTEKIIQLHKSFNKMPKRPRRGITKLRTHTDEGGIIFNVRQEVARDLYNHIKQHFKQPQKRRTPFFNPPLLQYVFHSNRHQQKPSICTESKQ